MNNRLSREWIIKNWNLVRVDQYAPDNSIVDWIEHTIGEDNWTVWWGEFYFERAQDATLFKLKFS